MTREEIFAPVLSVIVKRAHRMARALNAFFLVNAYNLYAPVLRFGGFKQSGFGRGPGEAALELYTERKSVWLDHF